MTRIHQIAKFIKQPIGIAVVAVVAASIIAGFYFTRPKRTAPETLAAKRGTIVREVSVTGNIKPAESVDLAFEKSGRVAQVNVSVGDRVNIGGVLAMLDQSELSAQLLQAKANIQAQQAKLDELKRGTRPEEIRIGEVKAENARIAMEDANKGVVDAIQDAYTKSDDAVRNRADQFISNGRSANPQLSIQISDPQLEIDIEQKRLDMEKILMLWNIQLSGISTAGDLAEVITTAKQNLGAASSFLDTAALIVNSLTPASNLSQTTINGWRSDISTARTNVNAAIANLSAADEKMRSAGSALTLAQNQLLLDRAGSSAEEISAQEALLKQAEANAAAVKAQIEKTFLYSPISGVVTRQDAKKGEIAPANAILVSLISEAKFEIEANIPEADIAKISLGDRAKVTLDAYGSDVEFEAAVAKIDPAETIIEGVATYKTTLQFARGDDRIRPGLTANIDILADKRENVIIIPQRAVQSSDGGKFVRIDAGRPEPEERKVTTGLRGSDGNIEIIDGIREGEKVITFVQEK